MKLTVLGKYGAYPAAGGATSSYLVQSGETAIILDFGSGAMSRLQKFVDVDSVRAIILSHLHYDHICDLMPLSYYLKARGIKIELIIPATDCFQRKLINELDGFNITELKPEMRLGEVTVYFNKMRHSIESYSVKLCSGGKALFYSGDTAFCEQLVQSAKGSDLLLLDCGRAEDVIAPHLSLSEAVFIAKTLSVPVIASHLNPELVYRSDSPLIAIAQEGKTYNV